MTDKRLSHSEMLLLKRWNTPTICNGWEQITDRDFSRECFNHEETVDFMPQMGSMIGYAVTLVIEPSNPVHKTNNPQAWSQYRTYVASIPAPKIVVVQDLDKPIVLGSFWGEVNSNIHRSLGCVGTITDGAIRDLDEMTNAGFKAIARRLCIGHAHVTPVRWDCEVEVFGCPIVPGQLIHADKHGFLVIPPEDEDGLLAAVLFMDSLECKTVIEAGRSTTGLSSDSILRNMMEADNDFAKAVRQQFDKEGEW
jgi:4-hydroxy-4-methyl-2-oxoglutarate aldolase